MNPSAGPPSTTRPGPMQREQIREVVTIPATTPLGQYHLLACVDVPHVVFEQNEVDNCTASSAGSRSRRPYLIEV